MLLSPQAGDPEGAHASCRRPCSLGSRICGWDPATICVSGAERDGSTGMTVPPMASHLQGTPRPLLELGQLNCEHIQDP